jgi:hypothetical protein
MRSFKQYTLEEGLRDIDKLSAEQGKMLSICLLAWVTSTDKDFTKKTPDEAYDYFLNRAKELYPEKML